LNKGRENRRSRTPIHQHHNKRTADFHIFNEIEANYYQQRKYQLPTFVKIKFSDFRESDTKNVELNANGRRGGSVQRLWSSLALRVSIPRRNAAENAFGHRTRPEAKYGYETGHWREQLLKLYHDIWNLNAFGNDVFIL